MLQSSFFYCVFAYALILKSLLGRDLGFEKLVNKLNTQLPRGTVNKYLNNLFESKEGFQDFVKRRGRRGPYYIPDEKRKKVELSLKKEGIAEVNKILKI
jgi:hypothetical protein